MDKPKAGRRRWVAACLAFLCALVSAPLAVLTLNQLGIEVPGAGSAQRLMALLDARSPGEREKGELSQTKLARKDVAQKPKQRALGKVFPPKPNPLEQLAKLVTQPPPAVPPMVDEGLPVGPLSLSDVVLPATPAAIPGLVPPTSIVGGSVIGGAPGDSGNVPPPPVTSAVPEPGTWLMMLVGFAMIGSAVRRRARPLVAEAA